jgi:hypothetical protein
MEPEENSESAQGLLRLSGTLPTARTTYAPVNNL